MVREAVMNMLQNSFADARILELFAGSGAFGIEALSRGAAELIMVENHPRALEALRFNLEVALSRLRKNDQHPRAQIVPRDLKKSLEQLLREGPYDVVWADPPYHQVAEWIKILGPVLPQLLNEGGIFALESDEPGHRALEAFIEESSLWQFNRQKSYGQTFVDIIERQRTELPPDSKE
jgi:16S rRNA (guanine966-N2)-methyltransferase